MNKLNAEITKLGINIKSIVRDYTKMRDWELAILVDKGYEEAGEEQRRRTGCSLTGKTPALEPK